MGIQIWGLRDFDLTKNPRKNPKYFRINIGEKYPRKKNIYISDKIWCKIHGQTKFCG